MYSIPSVHGDQLQGIFLLCLCEKKIATEYWVVLKNARQAESLAQNISGGRCLHWSWHSSVCWWEAGETQDAKSFKTHDEAKPWKTNQDIMKASVETLTGVKVKFTDLTVLLAGKSCKTKLWCKAQSELRSSSYHDPSGRCQWIKRKHSSCWAVYQA